MLHLLTILALAGTPDSQASIDVFAKSIDANLGRATKQASTTLHFGTEGASLVEYVDTEKKLVRIDATILNHTNRVEMRAYLVGDQLVRSDVTTLNYDKPMSGHVISKSTVRYYFIAGKLLVATDTRGRSIPEEKRGGTAPVEGALELAQARVACHAPTGERPATCDD